MEREQYQQMAIGAGLLAVVVAIATGASLAEDHARYRSCGFGGWRGSFRISLHFQSHHAYRRRRLIGR